jgi:HK97 family phage major capsid protein
MNSFLNQLSEKRVQKMDLIDATLTRAADEDRDISDIEDANVKALALEIEKLDARIQQVAEIETRKQAANELAKRVEVSTPETREAGGWKVTSEEPTYHARSANSFLSDAISSEFNNNYEAAERINRYNREIVLQKRDVGTAQFAGLVVPQYLIDLYANLARAGRPVADICRKHVLPAQGMTVNISRVTTGTAVGYQAAENDTATETNIDDTLLTVNVNTISGMQDVSKQAILRGANIEDVVLSDLISAYNTKLDFGILNGSGSSGEPTGMTTALTQVVTYTDASPTVAELYPKIVDAIQRVQSNVFAGPSHIIMHPRRLGFLLAATDTTGRPLVVPNANGPMNATGTFSGLGYGQSGQYSMLGLPIITDANVTITSGTGTNEDQIFVVSADELHLWEAPQMPTYVRFEQPDGKVAIRIVLFGFSAFTAGRRPLAGAIIGGTGLVTPTF